MGFKEKGINNKTPHTLQTLENKKRKATSSKENVACKRIIKAKN